MPQGTCYRRDGTMAYFYSRKGPWGRPMPIRGMDPTQVIPGHRYEINFETKEIVQDLGLNQYYSQDVAQHGLGAGGPVPGPAPAPQAAPAAPQPAQRPLASAPPMRESISRQSLMASATGIAKSAMESGKHDWREAIVIGIRWAWYWEPESAPDLDEVRRSVGLGPPPEYPVPKLGEEPGEDTQVHPTQEPPADFDDDIPF